MIPSKKIAIIAGCGDVVSLMKEAEEKGAEAYITGEIHCHIDNDYGRHKYSLIMDYVKRNEYVSDWCVTLCL